MGPRPRVLPRTSESVANHAMITEQSCAGTFDAITRLDRVMGHAYDPPPSPREGARPHRSSAGPEGGRSCIVGWSQWHPHRPACGSGASHPSDRSLDPPMRGTPSGRRTVGGAPSTQAGSADDRVHPERRPRVGDRRDRRVDRRRTPMTRTAGGDVAAIRALAPQLTVRPSSLTQTL
jgi:hypothetical protein